MNSIIADNIDSLRQLCLEHGVVHLAVFGSVLGDGFGVDSDIDFLVIFSRNKKTNAFHQYFDFKEALEKLLNREVDLVCQTAIQNPFFKREVEAQSQTVYAA